MGIFGVSKGSGLSGQEGRNSPGEFCERVIAATVEEKCGGVLVHLEPYVKAATLLKSFSWLFSSLWSLSSGHDVGRRVDHGRLL